MYRGVAFLGGARPLWLSPCNTSPAFAAARDRHAYMYAPVATFVQVSCGQACPYACVGGSVFERAKRKGGRSAVRHEDPHPPRAARGPLHPQPVLRARGGLPDLHPELPYYTWQRNLRCIQTCLAAPRLHVHTDKPPCALQMQCSSCCRRRSRHGWRDGDQHDLDVP